MKSLTTILGLTLVLTGCSSIKYGDPAQVETLTMGYGSTDLQTLAAGMSSSFSC